MASWRWLKVVWLRISSVFEFFTLHGSVLTVSIPVALISGAICFGLIYGEVVEDIPGGALMYHPNVFVFCLSLIGLVSAFHVNAAYGRYWEARTLLQRMDSLWSIAGASITTLNEHFTKFNIPDYSKAHIGNFNPDHYGVDEARSAPLEMAKEHVNDTRIGGVGGRTQLFPCSSNGDINYGHNHRTVRSTTFGKVNHLSMGMAMTSGPAWSYSY
eukprot:Lankesteria_metandrocarpae@DN4880_c0_g2_i1.p1